MELLDALQDAGASDDKARAAAQSVAAVGDTATKADIAQLEARLTWRMVGLVVPVYVLLALVLVRLS